MKLPIFCFLSVLATCGVFAELGFYSVATDSSQYQTPLIPGSKYHVHQHDRPQPPRVEPGAYSASPAPEDAELLFDGTSLEHFNPNQWKLVDGILISGPGGLQSKEAYGDFQMHMEWRTPDPKHSIKKPMNMGNNGLKIMGLYEIQIFDSYTCKIYADGSAGAVYGQTPPLVNACRKPGEWQTFDIYFTAPIFDGEELVTPGTVTILHNGIFIHNNTKILGKTAHKKEQVYKAHAPRLPFHFAGHGSPVQFRNIWIRDLD
ncbi:MAG: 3-keto-disaccharide hydrolase [Lentimonas sp.]